jgi:hypothetical protein
VYIPHRNNVDNDPGIGDMRKRIAPAGEVQEVFRDSAFAAAVPKTNPTAILRQHELENVRSCDHEPILDLPK